MIISQISKAAGTVSEARLSGNPTTSGTVEGLRIGADNTHSSSFPKVSSMDLTPP